MLSTTMPKSPRSSKTWLHPAPPTPHLSFLHPSADLPAFLMLHLPTPPQPISSHAASTCHLPHLLRTAFRLPASQRQPFSSDIVPVGAPGEGALGGRPSSLPLLLLW